MSDEPKPGLLPSWFETGTVTALLVPLFYTAGWSYAYHYFERFNLGLTGLEIPGEYFFVYSFWTIRDRFGWFLLTLAVFVTVLVFGKVLLQCFSKRIKDKSWRRSLTVVPALVLPLLIVGLFHTFYSFGETAGNNA